MKRIARLYEQFLPRVKHLPAGIYHYQSPAGPSGPYRLHLRLEEDGEGILIVNASTVLHLNHTAAEFAFYMVQSVPDNEVLQQVMKRYDIGLDQAKADYTQFKERINSLIQTPDLDPVTFLDFENKELYSKAISAPYRIDCALTYKLMEDAEAAPVDRVQRELSLDEWKKVLDKAWDVGIPHVIFTGGEPTLRPDLPDLIAHAEKLGMVAGLLTNGIRLAEPEYLQSLLLNGLDHLMILLDSENDQAWVAVRNVIPEDIQVTLHITITEQMLPEILPLLDYLRRLGAHHISLSVNDVALKDALKDVAQAVNERGMQLVWDLPVPYSQFHPVAFELAGHEEVPQGAGKAWLYVEPDGDVLPAQGVNQVLGNMLSDPWEKIWGKH
jgi:hypothetical protein